MKEKILTFIGILVFQITIYNVNAEAADYTTYKYIVVVGGGSSYYAMVSSTEDRNVQYDGSKFYFNDTSGLYKVRNSSSQDVIFSSAADAISFVQNNEFTIAFQVVQNQANLITVKGRTHLVNSVTPPEGSFYGTYGEYEETLIPKWYESAWDTFVDYFTNPVPFQWFKNLIDRVFDDDDETTISDNVNLASPTLTPAPTPIPYSTVVIPKTDINTGETYYETNYIYANPGGTPIVQPYPPTNTPLGNTGGSGDNYYPVDGEPLKLPKLKWLNPVTIGDSNYDGIDSIYDGLSSVDDIGSEYTDGISAVSDATSVLPTKWLMLIGIAAAIPLLAGIISRFLS